jgi:hypothetical protein
VFGSTIVMVRNISQKKKKEKNKQGERERVLSSEGKAWRMISLC